MPMPTLRQCLIAMTALILLSACRCTTCETKPRAQERRVKTERASEVQFRAPRTQIVEEIERWGQMRGIDLKKESRGVFATAWTGQNPETRVVVRVVPGTKRRHRVMMFSMVRHADGGHGSTRMHNWEWELVQVLEPTQAEQIEREAREVGRTYDRRREGWSKILFEE